MLFHGLQIILNVICGIFWNVRDIIQERENLFNQSFNFSNLFRVSRKYCGLIINRATSLLIYSTIDSADVLSKAGRLLFFHEDHFFGNSIVYEIDQWLKSDIKKMLDDFIEFFL